jgi:hypothetical protein
MIRAWSLVGALLILAGCGMDRQAVAEGTRTTRTITIVRAQAVHGDQIVELVTRTTTLTDEATGTTTTERTETDAPRVVGTLAGILRAGATLAGTATMGPAGGAVAGAAVDWVTQLIVGGTAAATAGGAGLVALRRTRDERDAARGTLRKVVETVDDHRKTGKLPDALFTDLGDAMDKPDKDLIHEVRKG